MADDFQEIHMPNGDVLQFPRDMPDEHIKAAIQKSIAPFSAPGYQIPPKAPPLGEALRDISMTAVKGIPVAGPLAAEPGHALISAAMGGGEGQDFNERYKDQLAKYTEQLKGFESAHPMETTVLGGAGGAAATGPMMMAAPAMFGATGLGTGANMVMGGVGGAGIGAADAYMRGGNPLAGGAIGGVLGGAAPGVARGAGALAQGAYDAFNPTAGNALLKGIDSRALDWAKRAAKADGLTPAQIDAKFQQLGPQGFLAEYGPNMRGLAGAAAGMPGEGKAEIFNAMEGRKSGVHQRVEAAFNQALGGRSSVASTADDIIARRSAAATPLYQQAYDAGDKVIWSPEMTRLSGAPEVQDAMKSAIAGWQRSQIANGYGAAQPGAMNDKGIIKVTGGRVPAFPNLQFWDYTKHSLDDQILRETRPDGTMTNKGRDLTIIVKKLREELDNQVPEYAAARQSWEGPTKVYQALDNGRTALSRSQSADELVSNVRGMNASERDAFLVGMRGELARLTDASTNGDTTARNLLMSRAAQDKLSALIGRQRAQQVGDAMSREATYAETHNRTIQNSETFARGAMGEMLKPNPDDTLVSRLRHMYSPHVTPGVLLPKVFEKAAAGRQEAQYEASRDALAPLLTQQGTSARDLAKALTEAGNRRNIKTPVSTYANLLLQGGLVPQSRQQLTPPQ